MKHFALLYSLLFFLASVKGAEGQFVNLLDLSTPSIVSTFATDKEVTLSLLLKSDVEIKTTLHGRWFRVSGETVIPMGQPIDLKHDVIAGQAKLIDLTLALPERTQQSSHLLQLFLLPEDSDQAEIAGSIFVHTYLHDDIRSSLEDLKIFVSAAVAEEDSEPLAAFCEKYGATLTRAKSERDGEPEDADVVVLADDETATSDRDAIEVRLCHSSPSRFPLFLLRADSSGRKTAELDSRWLHQLDSHPELHWILAQILSGNQFRSP